MPTPDIIEDDRGLNEEPYTIELNDANRTKAEALKAEAETYVSTNKTKPASDVNVVVSLKKAQYAVAIIDALLKATDGEVNQFALANQLITEEEPLERAFETRCFNEAFRYIKERALNA